MKLHDFTEALENKYTTSTSSKVLNESYSLTEKAWNYTLKSGIALRDAIDSEDTDEILKQLEKCYIELLTNDIIDQQEYDYSVNQLYIIDPDDEYAEDEIDYQLNDFYDLCDNLDVWIPLTEDCNKDNTLKESYSLVGQDGNAFSLMGYTARCMKECGLKDEIPEMREKATSGDYNNLIYVCDTYVQKCNDINRGLNEYLEEDFWNPGKEFEEFVRLLDTEFDNSEWNNWNQLKRDSFAEKVARRYLQMNPTPTPMFFQDLTDNNFHTERRAFEKLLNNKSLGEDFKPDWSNDFILVPKDKVRDTFLLLSNDPYAPDPFDWEQDYYGSGLKPDNITKKVVKILKDKGYNYGDNIRNWPEIVADNLTDEEMITIYSGGLKIDDLGDSYRIDLNELNEDLDEVLNEKDKLINEIEDSFIFNNLGESLLND